MYGSQLRQLLQSLGNGVLFQVECPACKVMDYFGNLVAEHSAQLISEYILANDLPVDETVLDELRDKFESPLDAAGTEWHDEVSSMLHKRATTLAVMNVFAPRLVTISEEIADLISVAYSRAVQAERN